MTLSNPGPRPRSPLVAADPSSGFEVSIDLDAATGLPTASGAGKMAEGIARAIDLR